MEVIELTKNESFIPWYERLHQNEFDSMIVEKIKNELNISLKQAKDMYKEFQGISIRDEQCKRGDGLYSFRYYVMRKVEELGVSTRQP